MTDLTISDLDDLVEQGLAEKRGDRYFPTDLGLVIAYAMNNWTPQTLPPEGVRYMSYNITTINAQDTGELIFSFNKAMQ